MVTPWSPIQSVFHSAARVILLKCRSAHVTPCLESLNSIPFLFKSSPNSYSWVKRFFSPLPASGLTIFPVSCTPPVPKASVGHTVILSLVLLAHAPHQPCQQPHAPASSCWLFRLGPGSPFSWKALLIGPLLAPLDTAIACPQGGKPFLGGKGVAVLCLPVGRAWFIRLILNSQKELFLSPHLWLSAFWRTMLTALSGLGIQLTQLGSFPSPATPWYLMESPPLVAGPENCKISLAPLCP